MIYYLLILQPLFMAAILGKRVWKIKLSPRQEEIIRFTSKSLQSAGWCLEGIAFCLFSIIFHEDHSRVFHPWNLQWHRHRRRHRCHPLPRSSNHHHHHHQLYSWKNNNRRSCSFAWSRQWNYTVDRHVSSQRSSRISRLDVEQPFCVLELNHPKQVHQTSLAKNGLNP